MEQVCIEKLAIRELCSRYCQTIDAQDSDGWAQCFAPDGAFEFDGHADPDFAALVQPLIDTANNVPRRGQGSGEKNT
jgi:hypothetical protein